VWDHPLGEDHPPRLGVVIKCPGCDHVVSASPDKWALTFHDDLTFSAVPSLHHVMPNAQGVEQCGWHVTINHGEY
jgi:hypothetical protein